MIDHNTEDTVQAVLDVYQTFHRADGKTIKLSPDRGEGKHWNLAPGNLYSKPQKVHVGPGGNEREHAVGEIERPQLVPGDFGLR